jgi:hypothetical protein
MVTIILMGTIGLGVCWGATSEPSKPSSRPSTQPTTAASHPATENSQEAFIEAYQVAHKAKDLDALAKLVYWGGTPELLKTMWRSEESARLGYPIAKIQVIPPERSHTANEYVLPLTATLAVTFDVSRKEGGMTVTGTQRVEYPVGSKDGNFYILTPKVK